MISPAGKHEVTVRCDGCSACLALGLPEPETMVAMPTHGWRDLGAGMTRVGIPFRHVCPGCFREWAKGELTEASGS